MGLLTRLLTSDPLDRLALEKRCEDLEKRCAQLYDENTRLRAEVKDPEFALQDDARIRALEAALLKAIVLLRSNISGMEDMAELNAIESILDLKINDVRVKNATDRNTR